MEPTASSTSCGSIFDRKIRSGIIVAKVGIAGLTDDGSKITERTNVSCRKGDGHGDAGPTCEGPQITRNETGDSATSLAGAYGKIAESTEQDIRDHDPGGRIGP